MALTLKDITFSAAEARKAAPEPFILVVFGASGDLTHRKLIPAVFGLDCQGMLPAAARVIGYARSEMTDERFREGLREGAQLSCEGRPLDEAGWRRFAERLSYHRGSYGRAEDFVALRERIERSAAEGGAAANCLFYLATPPGAFVSILRGLDEAGLARRGRREAPWSRVIIEKPFGEDLASARMLNEEAGRVFDERQIYRIDHFLGKETVQNLMVLRFANSIFEPIWHQKHVDHVQITVSESLGAEGRVGFYEQAGAIRDIVQNHMMHLLCLVAMEPPASLGADAIRDEKVKVLRALRPMTPQCVPGGVVRAQYAAGQIGGQHVGGYRELDRVAPDSTTETFVAFKAHVDNWRWSGVPFYLRTGKRLPVRRTAISIHFKPVPQVLFNAPPTGPLSPNVLTVRVQPDEGISMEFHVKVPGAAMRIRRHKMEFGYAESFGAAPPNAYQRLLLDAALGDATLFTRDDEVEAAWEYVGPLIEGCRQQAGKPLPTYPAGTWGPPRAERLIAEDGNRWHVVD